MLTFKQAFDRITEAYIKGEMHPYKTCGCFVGNLLNRKEDWDGLKRHCVVAVDRVKPFRPRFVNSPVIHTHEHSLEFLKTESEGTYTERNIGWLEYTFMLAYWNVCRFKNMTHFVDSDAVVDEDALFIAMEKTLDELKKIHIALGQDVEETVFTKRQLQITQ